MLPKIERDNKSKYMKWGKNKVMKGKMMELFFYQKVGTTGWCMVGCGVKFRNF